MRRTQLMIAIVSLSLCFGVAQASAVAAPDDSGIALNESSASAAYDNSAGSSVPPAHAACWKQAGIAKGVIEQRKSIVSAAREQAQSVQNDSALAPQQQKQQIRQIRVSSREQIRKLMTPEQQLALRQCREARNSAAIQQNSAGDPNAAPSEPQNPSATPQK